MNTKDPFVITISREVGSGVVAGRSGFHVFRDYPNTLNVFITAEEMARIILSYGGVCER